MKSIGRHALLRREKRVSALTSEPDDQIVAVDAAAHVAGHEGRDPAEHPALVDVGTVTEPVSDTKATVRP